MYVIAATRTELNPLLDTVDVQGPARPTGDGEHAAHPVVDVIDRILHVAPLLAATTMTETAMVDEAMIIVNVVLKVAMEEVPARLRICPKWRNGLSMTEACPMATSRFLVEHCL